jgi:hypothetical protein
MVQVGQSLSGDLSKRTAAILEVAVGTGVGGMAVSQVQNATIRYFNVLRNRLHVESMI